jgi:NosR/NirI family nitrous oxide reductase transcriptional regulator
LPTNLFDIMETQSDRTALRAAPWVQVWQNRTTEIIILCLSLVVLTVAFTQQNAISKKARQFHYFRWTFLFFTLLFSGFYAQGQLSVVNIYTLLLKVINGFSFDVFLLDPILFILWIYTAISLVLWGRGLFCGWLCPFGALQEMLSWLAKKVGIQQIQIKSEHHNRLLLLKYFILIGLLAISLYSLNLAEKLAEIEPFKTAITLLFVRSWPFAGYALLLLGLGMFIHKFYCRYLCPLGAGLAIIGKFRRFEWLNRRRECGTPCQMCRHRCEINAIHRNGTINYEECIQCLECIVIINDERQCAPARVALKNTIQTEQHNISVFPGSI